MYLILIIITFLILYTYLSKKESVSNPEKIVCILIFFLTVFQIYILSFILFIFLYFNLVDSYYLKISDWLKGKFK